MNSIFTVTTWEFLISSSTLGWQNYTGSCSQSNVTVYRKIRRSREGFRQVWIGGGYKSGHRGVLGAAVLTIIPNFTKRKNQVNWISVCYFYPSSSWYVVCKRAKRYFGVHVRDRISPLNGRMRLASSLCSDFASFVCCVLSFVNKNGGTGGQDTAGARKKFMKKGEGF